MQYLLVTSILWSMERGAYYLLPSLAVLDRSSSSIRTVRLSYGNTVNRIYFFTFTHNPEWEEIFSALLLNQKATDRPDLNIRVFRMKLRELHNDIHVKYVLGRPLAQVYTIEFQKHGLHHADILIILSFQDKPRDHNM